MAFRGLQAESVAQGDVHRNTAKELQTLVADPFNEWANDHKVTYCRSSVLLGIADTLSGPDPGQPRYRCGCVAQEL